ncbi:MAG: hypothetical protein ABDH31_05150, partial [Chlorobiota bacterium]
TQKGEGGLGPSPPTILLEYKLEAIVPWDRLSDFVRGVVMPLRQAGAEITLRIQLNARSQDGIKQEILEHKVRETLRQIGAKIVREETVERPQRDEGKSTTLSFPAG